MLKKIFFFNLLALSWLVLTGCKSTMNVDYQKAKNAKVITVPDNLSKKSISHQYVLKSAKKPIVVDYRPPAQA